MVTENGESGVLSSRQIGELIAAGSLVAGAGIGEGQVQPASIDLRLGGRAFRVSAAFRAGGKVRVRDKISALATEEIDLSSPAVFSRGEVYAVPLMEGVRLPGDVRGRANPKSTTGRLGVLVRLLAETGEEFDSVPAGYEGPLYLIVAPSKFGIVAAKGARLNQMRFIRGKAAVSDEDLAAIDREVGLVYHDGGRRVGASVGGGLRLTLDLAGSSEIGIVGYRAKDNGEPIDLAAKGACDPAAYFEPLAAGETDAVAIEPGDLYILATREKVRVPPGYAADMVAVDPALGEYRSHSSGFFDPGFGYGNGEVPGTRAVIQVRSHDVPLLLEHGQLVARLPYERMAEEPEAVYGAAIASSYQSQPVALGKQFRPFAAPGSE